MSITDFPILDSDRPSPAQPGGRSIIDYLGFLKPYVDETDYWCSMPMRLVHNPLAGFGIEIGPYTLDADDIHRLRKAVAAYELAVGQP